MAMQVLAIGVLAGIHGTAGGQGPGNLAGPGTKAETGRAGPAATEALPRVLLVPERETTLVAPMVGTVQQLSADLGGPVARGAIVARFECSEQRARVGMARAELQSASEQLAAKERLQGLAAAGDVEVSLARAALAKARAQVELGQAQAAHCAVAAPFSGRIALVDDTPVRSSDCVSSGGWEIPRQGEGEGIQCRSHRLPVVW